MRIRVSSVYRAWFGLQGIGYNIDGVKIGASGKSEGNIIVGNGSLFFQEY